MLYNLPGATGVNLAPATVGQLAREVDNIRYIKDTSADMAQAGQLIHSHGDVISTFVGLGQPAAGRAHRGRRRRDGRNRQRDAGPTCLHPSRVGGG